MLVNFRRKMAASWVINGVKLIQDFPTAEYLVWICSTRWKKSMSKPQLHMF